MLAFCVRWSVFVRRLSIFVCGISKFGSPYRLPFLVCRLLVSVVDMLYRF
jgi:hypothetical protein